MIADRGRPLSGNAIQDCENLKRTSGIPREELTLWVVEMKPRTRWTFLSNHSHVLIALAKNPELRIRDLAEAVGITERAVAQILSDLEAARVLKKRRVGRRNAYLVDANAPLRHAVESHRTVADILRLAEQTPFNGARNNVPREPSKKTHVS